MKTNSRWKNYGLWIAITSLIFMIVQDAGIQITPEKWNTYVDIVLWILVSLGIINNPQQGKGFGDKDE